MDIQSALREYIKEENFFAPDYDRENEALQKFQSTHTFLSHAETEYLKNILEDSDDIYEKIFVADLMYLYNPIPDNLLPAMLRNGIKFEDPSFNRIFLRPCIKSFGYGKIEKMLDEIEHNGSTLEKVGVARLRYWLRPIEPEIDDG